jgi:hypothetical protein
MEKNKITDHLKLSELAKDWINAWNKGDINSRPTTPLQRSTCC